MSQSDLSPSRFALWFFAGSCGLLITTGLCAWGLISAGRALSLTTARLLPPAFWISTLLLLAGSIALQRALHYVKVEKQLPFRRNMVIGLVCAGLFLAVQSFALWSLLESRQSDAARVATGATAFVFVLAGLHALHVIVANLFLVFVTLKSLTNRYDHEYYWGVTVCTFFWHGLGVVWLAILAVLLAASLW